MDGILYGIFLLAQFGLPLAAVVFIVICSVRGEIKQHELKAAGLAILWVAGGIIFSSVLCALMGATAEGAERICFAMYCCISVVAYFAYKRKKERGPGLTPGPLSHL